MNLSPIYFPFTDMPRDVLTAASAFFPRIARYIPSGDSQSAANQQASGLEIELRRPFGEDSTFFETLYQAYREWAELQQGNDLAFFKSRQSKNIPFFSDVSTPHHIRDMIQRNASAGSEEAVSGLLRARLFLRLAEAFDQQQRELKNGLHSLSQKEQRMFSSLIGEDAEEILNEIDNPQIFLPEPGMYMTFERLAAWTCLFHCDPSPTDFLLTSSRAVLTLLFEYNSDVIKIGEYLAPLGYLDSPLKIRELQAFLAATLTSLRTPSGKTCPSSPSSALPNDNTMDKFIRLELYKIPGKGPYCALNPFLNFFDTSAQVAPSQDSFSETIVGMIEFP